MLCRSWNPELPFPFSLSTRQLFVHTMSIAGQILSFVSVGYERYHTVSNPFDKEKIRRITHFSLVGCWVVSILIAGLEIHQAPDTVGYYFCTQNEGSTNHRGVLFIMLPFGLLCFLLVAFFYGRILWLVRTHCKNISATCNKLPVPNW